MDFLWNWLAYQIPWWLQAIVIAVIIGAPTYLVVAMIWGREAANRALLVVIGIAAVMGAASRLRQQGYTDRRAEEEKALDKAEDFVDDKRHEIDRLPDEELDKEIDRWSKP